MTLFTWLVILILISVNALYVAAEFAAVSVRRSKIRQLADEGNLFARRLLPALQDAAMLDRYVAACQIGITLSSLVLGAFGQATLAREFVPYFVEWGGLQTVAAQSTSAVVVLVGLTLLQVVFGELVPKSLALQYSTQAALYTIMPMRVSLTLFSWFIAILNGSGIAILKWLRVPYGGHRHIHSPEEIDLLIAESRDGGLLEEDEHHRLHEALQLTTRTAGELMVPRRYITAVDIDMPLEQVLVLVGEGPYTRVPVYRNSLDNIVGIIHAKDLMLRFFDPGGLAALSQVMRPAVFVPEHATTDRLLTTLREQRSHQAIVIDEYGGVEGLVTLEDVLTELLGEVGDEFKADQPEPETLPDGRVRLPGLLHLDGIEQWTGIPWEGEASTVGGYVTEVLEHIPAEGERTTIDGVVVEVERMENHAVVSILITPVPAREEEY
jgi:CBS domain containing-hemolysin-like protein